MLTSNKKALAVFLIAFKFVRYLHFIRLHMCRKMVIIDSFDKRYYFNITNQNTWEFLVRADTTKHIRHKMTINYYPFDCLEIHILNTNDYIVTRPNGPVNISISGLLKKFNTPEYIIDKAVVNQLNGLRVYVQLT